MKYGLYTTNELNEKIKGCENIQEFKDEIIQKCLKQRELWIEKIHSIIEENGYTVTKFAELCNVSRVSVTKWLKGALPKKRELFIRIGFAAGYDLAEMNNFLMRYGRYQGLYAKSLEDSVCIFVLSSNNIEHTYERYGLILNEIKNKLGENETDSNEQYETSAAMTKILDMDSEQKMLEFINQNVGLYKNCYNKFYSYVLAFLRINKMAISDEKLGSTNFMANGQDWSASLRRCISEINQKKWYPSRDKIISIGIHLNMDVEQINEMLELAYMEPLYSKNIFESVIIYALENAKLEDQIFCDGTDALCLYVKDIIEELDIEELDFFVKELPDDY